MGLFSSLAAAPQLRAKITYKKRMKTLLLATAVVCSVAAHAQKVSNKLQFQKGQTLEMKTTLTSQSEMMGQAIKVDVASTRNIAVQNVSGGGATLENRISHLQVAFDGMGQTQAYDSDKPADKDSEMGKSLGKALKNTYTMNVDAYGKITGVTPAADNPNATKDTAAEGGDMMSGMMDGLLDGFALPAVGDETEFAILPAKEVSKGTTWTDTTASNGDEKRKADFTVTDITASEILIDYTEEINTKTTKQNMGMEVQVDKKDANTGKIVLDRKTGLLKQRTVNTQTSGTASVMGQEIPLDAKTTKTIVVTAGK